MNSQGEGGKLFVAAIPVNGACLEGKNTFLCCKVGSGWATTVLCRGRIALVHPPCTSSTLVLLLLDSTKETACFTKQENIPTACLLIHDANTLFGTHIRETSPGLLLGPFKKRCEARVMVTTA